MLVELIATVAAVAGNVLDARTTQVALGSNKGREANPVSRFIIERTGFVGFYIVKAAVIPAIGILMHSTNTLFYIGAIGGACGAWNYFMILRKNKLSIF